MITRTLCQIELRIGRKWRAEGQLCESASAAASNGLMMKHLWNAEEARYREVIRQYAGPGYSNSRDTPSRKPVYL